MMLNLFLELKIEASGHFIYFPLTFLQLKDILRDLGIILIAVLVMAYLQSLKLAKSFLEKDGG